MMQPGAVPGAVYEFHAAKAALGTGPGINAPLTTQAFDTSGNLNHGTLTNFSGESPWLGAGTIADPYRLAFDPAAPADYIALPNLGVGSTGDCAYEAWFKDDSAYANVTRWIMCESVGSIRWGMYSFGSGIGFQTRDATVSTFTPLFGNFASDGLWHHVLAGVASGYLKLFIDGVDRSGAPVAARPPATFTTSQIGARGGIESWNGGIAVGRQYRFAPTLAMAQQNRNAGPLWAPAVSGLPVVGSPIVQGMRV